MQKGCKRIKVAGLDGGPGKQRLKSSRKSKDNERGRQCDRGGAKSEERKKDLMKQRAVMQHSPDNPIISVCSHKFSPTAAPANRRHHLRCFRAIASLFSIFSSCSASDCCSLSSSILSLSVHCPSLSLFLHLNLVLHHVVVVRFLQQYVSPIHARRMLHTSCLASISESFRADNSP